MIPPWPWYAFPSSQVLKLRIGYTKPQFNFIGVGPENTDSFKCIPISETTHP